jgi:S-adenosylmethionine synthetase
MEEKELRGGVICFLWKGSSKVDRSASTLIHTRHIAKNLHGVAGLKFLIFSSYRFIT